MQRLSFGTALIGLDEAEAMPTLPLFTIKKLASKGPLQDPPSSGSLGNMIPTKHLVQYKQVAWS